MYTVHKIFFNELPKNSTTVHTSQCFVCGYCCHVCGLCLFPSGKKIEILPFLLKKLNATDTEISSTLLTFREEGGSCFKLE